MPVLEWTEPRAVSAQVWALGTDAVISSDRNAVISRYKMVIAPVLDIPPTIGNDMRISWGPFQHTGSGALYPDGTVERHYYRGRLHHYELITRQVV
nr:hypothetical protein [Rhodococcus sp. 06-156-3b]